MSKFERRRVGAPSTKSFMDMYASHLLETSGTIRVFDENRFICPDCHLSLRKRSYHLIVPIVRTNLMINEAPQVIDRNNSTLEIEYEMAELPVAISGSQVTVDSQASTLYDDSWMDTAEQSTSLNSQNSLDSYSSAANDSMDESYLFAIPKQVVKVGFPSCVAPQRGCFICKAVKQNRIPKEALRDVWYQKGIMLHQDNRCCPSHLENGLYFNTTAMDAITANREYMEMTGLQIKRMFMTFFDAPPGMSNSAVSFKEDSHYTSEDYHKLTGLSRQSFDDMFRMIEHQLRDSCNRSKRDALGMFMMKLKTNLSQAALAILFGVKCQSRVSDSFESVRAALEKHFVPKHLGYDHITREESKVHQSSFVRKLFGAPENSICALADGTYLYIQKPSDHDLQKATFSMHKKRNLLKPMLITFPDGYILSCEGLYFADGSNNDANIMKSLALSENGFSKFFQKDDFFILDRGFRDAIEDLNNKGYATFMPNLLAKKQLQFSTIEANQSRRVTIARWRNEATNGVTKRFKMISDVIQATYIPKLGSIYKIVCAIVNTYSTPLFKDTEETSCIADKVLIRMTLENDLQNNIENVWKLDRKISCWEAASIDSIIDFPVLSEDNLRGITLGSYQLSQAALYTRRHLKNNSRNVIYVHKEMPGLLRSKIESRYTKGKVHNLWIQFDKKKLGEDSIVSYFCKCRVGSRTVGCCSHISSVLWYLGFARHQEKDLIGRSKGLAENILDAALVLEAQLGNSTVGSSEDEDDN